MKLLDQVVPPAGGQSDELYAIICAFWSSLGTKEIKLLCFAIIVSLKDKAH